MRLHKYVYDREHPLRSPALGSLISRTLCLLGHRISVMELESWDEPWLACSVCGARFMPADVITDDTEVVKI